jgi:hypothetical protein
MRCQLSNAPHEAHVIIYPSPPHLVLRPLMMFSITLAREAEGQWHEYIAWSIIYLSLPVFLTLHYIIPAPWGKLLQVTSSSSSLSFRSSSNAATSSRKSPQQRGVVVGDILLSGPRIPARWAWFLFESPNLVWAMYAWCHRRRQEHENDDEPLQLANYILYFMFVAHYVQRAILYPLCMSARSKRMPCAVVVSAFGYCSLNG